MILQRPWVIAAAAALAAYRQATWICLDSPEKWPSLYWRGEQWRAAAVAAAATTAVAASTITENKDV